MEEINLFSLKFKNLELNKVYEEKKIKTDVI